MIPFIPDTGATIAYAVALACVCLFTLYRRPKLWPIVAVMVLNWLGTRAVSSFELSGLVQATVDIGSAALLLTVRQRSTMVVLTVAALFSAMVLFSCVYDLGLITRDTMWAWADVAAYCQLIIIAGSASAGGGHARLAMGRYRRHRVGAVVRSLANRIQNPPSS